MQNPLSGADPYRIQVRQMREYAMFMLDSNGILLTWNAGVQALFGYTEEEWVGQPGSLIFTPPEKAEELCRAEMRTCAEMGSAADIRWHRRKDGSEFFAHGYMDAVCDPAGAIIGYAKVMNDETARKRLEDSLTESNTALEQFAYVASHDMQEPLRTMGSYAQLLSKRYKGRLDEDADVFLGFLAAASVRMSTLIRDLLSYARVSADHNPLVSVSLDDDLESALAHLATAIEESGGSVTHDPLPVVSADRGQMVRLFQNLVGNALKYRAANRPPRVHISAQRKGQEWIIAVRDNGIGFDPSRAPLIFAPFKRLHSAEEYPGSGVGLAICRRIVERHGGRIWADATPGEGAVFYFSLPVSDQSARSI